MNMSGRILTAIIVVLVCTIGCSSFKGEMVGHEIADYDLLTTNSTWSRINQTVKLGQVAIIEKVEGKLGILVEQFSYDQRPMDSINYIGFAFYHDPNLPLSNLSGQQLVGINTDPGLINKIKMIDKQMRQLPIKFTGTVLVLDSLAEITLDQAKFLAGLDVEALMFCSVKHMTSKEAGALAEFKGERLCLDGLLWVSELTALELASFSGDYLSLNSIRTVDQDEIAALMSFKGMQISLESLTLESRIMVDDFKAQNELDLITLR